MDDAGPEGVDRSRRAAAAPGEGRLAAHARGGAGVHRSFLKAGLVDELVLFVAPKLFGHGGLTWSGALGVEDPAKALQFEALDAVRVGPELMVTASAIKT